MYYTDEELNKYEQLKQDFLIEYRELCIKHRCYIDHDYEDGFGIDFLWLSDGTDKDGYLDAHLEKLKWAAPILPPRN